MQLQLYLWFELYFKIYLKRLFLMMTTLFDLFVVLCYTYNIFDETILGPDCL